MANLNRRGLGRLLSAAAGAAVAMAAAASSVWAQTPQDEGGRTKAIEWLTDLASAQALAARTRKPVVVAFFAAWCPSCRRFRSDTLPAAEIQDLADRFHWVMIDIDRNVSLARARHVEATPRFDLVDPDGVTRVKISGVFSPALFRGHAEAFLAEVHRIPHSEAESQSSSFRADDRTALTWSPTGFRGLSICFSNVGYGPLNLPSQSPFQSLRSGFRPRTPSTIADGHGEFRATAMWVNVWGQEDDYLLDYEMLRSEVSIAYGITDTIEVDLEILDKSRFGGVMDGLVQGFHNVFNIDQGGRDGVPKRDFSFDIEGPPKVSLTNRDRGRFSQDLRLTLQHNVTCGTEELPAIAYSLTLRADRDPFGELRGGSPVDVALSSSAAKRFGDVYGYLGVGLAWFGKEAFRGLELRATQLSLLVAFEWRFSAEMSLVLQYLVSQGVASNLGQFSAPSNEITLGWKWEFARGWVVEFGFIENLPPFDNSPDAGFHGALTFRF